jgi:hypothetical protein
MWSMSSKAALVCSVTVGSASPPPAPALPPGEPLLNMPLMASKAALVLMVTVGSAGGRCCCCWRRAPPQVMPVPNTSSMVSMAAAPVRMVSVGSTCTAGRPPWRAGTSDSNMPLMASYAARVLMVTVGSAA